MREMFSSGAKARVDGTRCRGRSWPSVTALRNQSYSWRYIGILLRRSSAMGGRKLAEMRGILRHPLHVMYRALLRVVISYQLEVAIAIDHYTWLDVLHGEEVRHIEG